MKIKFTKLPTNDGIIKVSLDGGQSFTDYNVADVHESGIPLADSQDYEKIQIQAPANILKNLNVVSGVKVGDDSGIDENNSLPITTIYYRLYDAACGACGFTLREGGCGYYPDFGFDPRILYVQINGSYESLNNLCESEWWDYSMFDTANFTGDLYVRAEAPVCPYSEYYIRVPYRLEKW